MRFPGRSVAIKVGIGVRKDDHFFREARLLGQLNSDFVVSVYEYGTDEGVPYIVMEFLDGRTLADLLHAAAGQLPPDMIGKCIDEVGRALASLHALNVIHRDLKPDNIMLVDAADSLSHGEIRQRFKIIDFGISSKIDAEDSRRNVTFDGAGTPEYMAPEQLLSESITAQSDVYSLGVLIFVLYSGRVPFPAAAHSVSALADLVNCVLNQAPPKLSEAVAPDVTVSHELEVLVADCLAKRPEDRPATVAEVCLRYRKAVAQLDAAPEFRLGQQGRPDKPHQQSRRKLVIALLLPAMIAITALIFGPKFIGDLMRPNGDAAKAVTSIGRLQEHDFDSDSSIPPEPDSPDSHSPSAESAAELTKVAAEREITSKPDVGSQPDLTIEPAIRSVTDVAGVQPELWSAEAFTRTGPLTESCGRVYSQSLQLTDFGITFVLVAPEQLQSSAGRIDPPATPFYISEFPVSRQLYTKVTGDDIDLPAKPAATEEPGDINLEKLDVDDLIGIIESNATKNTTGRSPGGVTGRNLHARSEPVTNLTWFDCDRFCLLLTEQVNSARSRDETVTHRFRLPQASEWWAAAGYFSAEHVDPELVSDPAVTGVKDLASPGFEWTRTSVSGEPVTTMSLTDHSRLNQKLLIVTPGHPTKPLAYGMINAPQSTPAGESGNSMTTFRVVLEVPLQREEP